MAATKRRRMKFEFWLELQKVDDLILTQQIATLKRHHQFIGVIRDGIRLICDLRAGRVDVLLELFPGIGERFQSAEQGRASEIFEQMVQMQAALDALRSQIAAQPVAASAPRQPVSGGVVVAEGATGKASAETCANNFLASMKSMASGFFD